WRWPVSPERKPGSSPPGSPPWGFRGSRRRASCRAPTPAGTTGGSTRSPRLPGSPSSPSDRRSTPLAGRSAGRPQDGLQRGLRRVPGVADQASGLLAVDEDDAGGHPVDLEFLGLRVVHQALLRQPEVLEPDL